MSHSTGEPLPTSDEAAASIEACSVSEDTATEPAPEWSGRLLILSAAVLWSTSGFFAKAPWFDAWPVETRGALLAFWRSFFALLILLPLIRRPTWRPQIIPMIVCFAVMIWSFLSAMVQGGAANAIWLQYLCPVWVLLISIFIFKEKPGRAELLMFAFCFAGVGLIVVRESQYGSPTATALAILSGISYAGVILCLRSMRGVDAVWLIALNHAGSALLLSPWVFTNEHHVPWTSYLALAFFGTVQISIPYIMFAWGLRHTRPSEASVLTLVEPLLLPLWAFFAWNDQPPIWTIIGGGLILIGLVSRYAPIGRKK